MCLHLAAFPSHEVFEIVQNVSKTSQNDCILCQKVLKDFFNKFHKAGLQASIVLGHTVQGKLHENLRISHFWEFLPFTCFKGKTSTKTAQNEEKKWNFKMAENTQNVSKLLEIEVWCSCDTKESEVIHFKTSLYF